MIQFAKEPLTDALWAEAMPLLQAHWKEVAAFQDIPLNPDRALYAASEEAGILRVFTARDFSNRRVACPLVGYALYFVRPAPHYQSSVQAVQDVLYLAPEHRGRTALKFIAWCDEQLSIEGVQVTYQHIKTVLPNAHRALKHLGYVEVDTIYAKRLDGVVNIGDSDVATSSYVQYKRTEPAMWRGESVKVIGERDGRAVIIVEGYVASNTVPLTEITWLDVRLTETASDPIRVKDVETIRNEQSGKIDELHIGTEMGQDWRDQAQHDYDTARFVGQKP